MKELSLEVITPSKKEFSGMVKSITVPGSAGSFQVLYNHAPIISTFDVGFIKIINTEGVTFYFATSGGSIEVNDNKALILAESFEKSVDIDIDRAKAARQRAQDRLHQRDHNLDIKRAEAALARAVNRIMVFEKYRV
ncbi:MAG: ATP synthase F1 subunit epsilon [Bacteroidota bacterium]